MTTPAPAFPAWVSGRLVPAGEPAIPAEDQGLLHGMSVYDTLLLEDGVVLFAERHLERFARACDELGIDLPWQPREAIDAYHRALVDAGHDLGPGLLLRLTATRGTAAGPVLLVTARRAERVPADGVTLALAATHKVAADPTEGIKSTNRLRNVLAREEARAHSMSTEVSVAHCEYLGERWSFLDCPGSVEFANDSRAALAVADIAIVVCDPVPDKALAVAPLLHHLDAMNIPHLIFINKVDHMSNSLREMMHALQEVSDRPLVLRQVPIRDGDTITGFVDLASERAYAYEEGQPSKLISLPDSVKDREEEARQEMLEALADFDDELLEKLLEDAVPSTEEVFAQFTKDLEDDLIVPVLFGAAEHENGIVVVPDGPGLGIEINRKALAAFAPS